MGSSGDGAMTRPSRTIVTSVASAHRRTLRKGELDEVGLTLAQRHEPDEVADADGLLDQGAEQAWGRHGDVDAPHLVEHPLVLRVVDAGDDARHAVLGLGEQRDDEVDLVVAGGGDDDVARLQLRLVEGGDLAGVGEQPGGAGDAVGVDRARLLVDEQEVVAVLDQLEGDGPADGSGSGDGDAHQ
jgi:hypothetical protein